MVNIKFKHRDEIGQAMKYRLKKKKFMDKRQTLKQYYIIINIIIIYTFHSPYCVKLKVQYYTTNLITYMANVPH